MTAMPNPRASSTALLVSEPRDLIAFVSAGPHASVRTLCLCYTGLFLQQSRISVPTLRPLALVLAHASFRPGRWPYLHTRSKTRILENHTVMTDGLMFNRRHNHSPKLLKTYAG
jgi:hypothetical protein